MSGNLHLASAGFALAATVLIGCGGDPGVGSSSSGAPAATPALGEKQAIAGVVDSYFDALEAQDPVVACGLLAPSQVERWFKSAERCERAIGRLMAGGAFELTSSELRATRVEGDGATAEFEDGSSLTLRMEGGAWYIHLVDP